MAPKKSKVKAKPTKVKSKKKRFSKSELNVYKKLLVELRQKLLAELEHVQEDTLNRSQKEASGDLSGYSLHMADAATDNYDTEFRLGLATKEQRMLKEIELALHKVEDGSYGMCEKYDTPIPVARLKAMPYARYSIKAQEEMEKQNNP